MIKALRIALFALVAGTLVGGGSLACAQGIKTQLAAEQAAHDVSRDIQAQIDRLSGALRGPSTTLEDRQLAERIRQIQSLVDEESARIDALTAQIRDLQEAEAGLMPLLHSMLDMLDLSIEIDLPFDTTARKAALVNARRALSQHDLALADRYAHVLNAYLAEVRYGYDSDIASGVLPIDGETRLVRLIRIGRLALYYLSEDARECGVWISHDQGYVALDQTDCGRLAEAVVATDLAGWLSVLPLPGEEPS